MTSHTNVPMTPTRCFTTAKMENRKWRMGPFSILHFPFSASQLPEGAHLERRHGADDTGSSGKFGRNDAGGFDGGTKGAAPHFGAQWREQRLTGAGDAAGDDDDVRIDDVQQR